MSAHDRPLQDSCPSLSELVSLIQALHVVVVSVMTDLFALRRTLLDDPELEDLYANNLQDASSRARPMLAEAMQCYENLTHSSSDITH